MALTLIQFAAGIRIGDGVTALEEPRLTIVTRAKGVAEAYIEKVAPLAPDVVQDEAVIRLGRAIYDSPPSTRGFDYASSFVNSGAGSLLAPWRNWRRALSPDEVTP